MELIRECASGIENLKVDHFENEFLVKYAARTGATHLVRGIRHEDDFQFERTMRYVNEDIHPGLVNVYFMPPRDLAEVSSSFVKGLVGPAGWQEAVRRYVPEPVFEALVARHGGDNG